MSLLELDGLTKFFRDRRRSVTAVSDVSLSVEEGETVGLIGESGSGKSTLARLAAVLMRPDRGRVMLDGVDLLGLGKPALRARRAQFQMVFQEPLQSLNPRMTVESIVAEPLSVHRVAETKATHRELVHRVLEQVGLPAAAARRRPGQLSGGQQQRVGIARAVVLRPRLLILDEPTSSLDVSIRANILNLLGELQRDLDLAYLFISHDLSTVRYFCSRTVVLRRGVIVESGPTDQVLEHPSHDYTTELLRASLSPTPPSAD